ncbi:hypothetical protein ACEWY4_002177 [Coilia grayii]|uniref:VPS10 domain-containing protein n=1 Tax=Coilia grayii TaxID=363190 RepID=A0ABD1KV27_9TELE
MLLKVIVCCGVWSVVLSSSGLISANKREPRTVTLSRTLRTDRQGQVRSRSRRESWFGASNFAYCRQPLSPSEHRTLDFNTHETGFHGDDGSSFILTWVGDGTGVILVLSTISAPLDSFYEGGSSRLYRSEDYGKTFHDISHAINHTFIRKDFGVSAGPGNSKQVILTANVPITKTEGGVIFTSEDTGITFQSVTLPFHPAQPITFNFQNPNYLVAISTDGDLWLSLDFGNEWAKVHDGAHSFMWGANITLYFSFSPRGTVEPDRRGELYLKRTKDLGQTFTTIAQNIFSFGYIGGFLFTSVMEKLESPRVIYVSSDQGDTFNKAQLPSASTEQFYSVLDGDEDMIFMHVDKPGEDTYYGTVYTSDDQGILYSKSLERHMFGGEGKSDFTNITSLRGVYLTNVLDEDGGIRTVISFDRGGEWRRLEKPENVKCGVNVKNCNLHIHGEHSRYNNITPMLPLTDPTAIGLVIAHGSVGDSMSAIRPDVYVSRDGGYTWFCTLKGPHHYSILDSGGLIVAVEAHKDRQINSIKFSTDEGQCWKLYNFTDHPIFFAGLASEPGSKTMNISVWGYRPEDDDQPMWVAVTIDFERLLTRECEEKDYVYWLAHARMGEASETNGCVLGYKETYRRLRRQSVCRNGRDYVVIRKQTPCPCTRDDYMCDYGYYRHENSSECVKQADFVEKKLELCVHGVVEELETLGYRKVPSDKCEGGFIPLRRVSTGQRRCGNASQASTISPHPEKPVDSMMVIVVCASMGVVVLVISVAIFITVKRMTRRRPPEYLFSALRLQDDDQCMHPGPDSQTSSNRGSYQADSDDELIQ